MAKYGEQKIQEVLHSFALTGSYSETSRDVGVPNTTVRRWVAERSKEVAAIKQEYIGACSPNFVKEAIEFKDQFGSGVRKKLLDCIEAVGDVLGRVEVTEQDLATLRGHRVTGRDLVAFWRSRLTGQELAALLRELTKAMQLIEGEPTERVEHTIWDKISEAIEKEE